MQSIQANPWGWQGLSTHSLRPISLDGGQGRAC